MAPLALASTRVVFLGTDNKVVKARSMNWKTDIGTTLWILPRSMARNSEADPRSIKWVSRYGGVIASAYDVSTSDGMNEKGLVANLLWLAESEYPKPGATQPDLALSLWAQYYSFASFAKWDPGSPSLVIPSSKRQGHISAWSVPRYRSVANVKFLS